MKKFNVYESAKDECGKLPAEMIEEKKAEIRIEKEMFKELSIKFNN